MKNQLFSLLLFLSLLTSCTMNHEYKYVEVILDRSVFGNTDRKEKKPEIIKAESDSAAYLKAYQSFCISIKVNKDMLASMGEVYSTPLSFKLYNEKGEDITNMYFPTKSIQEKEIENLILSLNTSMNDTTKGKKNVDTENDSKTIKIDTAKVKDLEKYFRIKVDEFSNNNKKWYEPKNAPQYANRNGIYCYFTTENGIASNLRFRVQYYADDWLFFSKVQFSVDGTAYEYIPDKTETDSGNGGYIWEWFDQSLTSSDKELIFALANAKNAKMKFIGRQYFNLKTISQDQILNIKRTIDLYNALGGQY